MTARLRFEQMVALGRTRSTPRHWMRGRISPAPGLRFLYWSRRPSICALVVGNAIVTVVTRSMFRAPTMHEVRRAGRPRPVEPSRWRWERRVDDELEAA
jgi:hypothetical protein